MNKLWHMVILLTLVMGCAHSGDDNFSLKSSIHETIRQKFELAESGFPSKEVVTWDEVRAFRIEKVQQLEKFLKKEENISPEEKGALLLQLSSIMYELNDEDTEKEYRNEAFQLLRKKYSNEKDLIRFIYNLCTTESWYILLDNKIYILDELNNLVGNAKQSVESEVENLLHRHNYSIRDE